MAYPPLTLDSVMPFGQYKGRLIKHIVGFNAAYILWLKGSIFTEEVIDAAIEANIEQTPNPWEGCSPGDLC